MSVGEERAAHDRAVRLLANRDHSSASLHGKLERAGFSAPACEAALAELVRAGYVDDARFAQARAAQLASRGYGDEWIRGDLDVNGIPPDLADHALAGLEPEAARARAQAARLGRPARAVRVLQRRGFSEGSLEGIVSRVVADDP